MVKYPFVLQNNALAHRQTPPKTLRLLVCLRPISVLAYRRREYCKDRRPPLRKCRISSSSRYRSAFRSKRVHRRPQKCMRAEDWNNLSAAQVRHRATLPASNFFANTISTPNDYAAYSTPCRGCCAKSQYRNYRA